MRVCVGLGEGEVRAGVFVRVGEALAEADSRSVVALPVGDGDAVVGVAEDGDAEVGDAEPVGVRGVPLRGAAPARGVVAVSPSTATPARTRQRTTVRRTYPPVRDMRPPPKFGRAPTPGHK
jgi:hypothetical protein